MPLYRFHFLTAWIGGLKKKWDRPCWKRPFTSRVPNELFTTKAGIPQADESPAGKMKLEFLENPSSTLLGQSQQLSYFKKIQEELGLYFHEGLGQMRGAKQLTSWTLKKSFDGATDLLSRSTNIYCCFFHCSLFPFPVTDRLIGIDIFGCSERLVWLMN